MAAFTRAMVPVVALGVGSWLGLGRPDVRTALAAGARAVSSASGLVRQLSGARPGSSDEPTEHARGDVVPPQDRARGVDGAALPDPPAPWPRLNPDANAERAWLLAEGPAHAAGDGRRLVTFTFDDGPFPETAPTVLRILAQHRIHATFFLIGEYLEGDDKRATEARMWAKRIADAGHLVGNHTYDHHKLTSLSHASALAEIDDCSASIERATGKRPLLFRPPYGEVDPWLQGVIRDRGLELLLWSIDVEDMKREDPEEIVRALEQQLDFAQGGVVLLHDMHWPSVKAFNRLLRWLDGNRWDAAHPEKRGWDIVDLPEYLRSTAASPQPYPTREALERARQGMKP
jgi:peptidoglycan/xylan/chitin deacetylase (PgdA/CDA1 family)